jgi:hypothetical protein
MKSIQSLMFVIVVASAIVAATGCKNSDMQQPPVEQMIRAERIGQAPSDRTLPYTVEATASGGTGCSLVLTFAQAKKEDDFVNQRLGGSGADKMLKAGFHELVITDGRDFVSPGTSIN